MPPRSAGVMRVCRQVLMSILLGALVAWAAAAPLVWILRDGLGPDMVESTAPLSVIKFLVGWSIPALVLAAPLVALWILERRSTRATDSDSPRRHQD